MKNLKIGELKMVILATNLEKVDQDRGTDEVICKLMQTCRRMQVPLVFAFDRYKLGCLAKFQGQKVSCVGISNFQGANEIYNRLVDLTGELRELYYRNLSNSVAAADLMLLRKEN